MAGILKQKCGISLSWMNAKPLDIFCHFPCIVHLGEEDDSGLGGRGGAGECCEVDDTEGSLPAPEPNSLTDTRFLTIFKNLWIIRVVKMARSKIGPSLKRI